MAMVTTPPTAGALPPGHPDADLDRCDRCNADGRVQIRSPRGASLVFCKHHFEHHELALLGWEITRDTRAALAPRPDHPGAVN